MTTQQDASAANVGRTVLPSPPPYTHALHISRGIAAHFDALDASAVFGSKSPKPCEVPKLVAYVQVRLSQVTHCARVVDAWQTSDGVHMWSVELLGPWLGRGHVPCNRATQCSGLDGRCQCAGESW